MNRWTHRHILDLSTFTISDYEMVLELANRFKVLPESGARKLPALQGKLISTLFFEPSTRTRSSFELAAKRLSAEVQSLNLVSSSISKGETPLDTALTYVAMGADVLIIRHSATNVPEEIARYLEDIGKNTAVLNGGDGLHSHPSQGLIDLYTLAKYFCPKNPIPEKLKGKNIVIVGDILHSRVARSNIWAFTGCGANVTLCGPPSLVPEYFEDFAVAPPTGQKTDPIKSRGKVKVIRSLESALTDASAIIALRLQKERMRDNLLSDLDRFHKDYGITHEKLKLCKKNVPVLHPGPANRGVEISSSVLDDRTICLAEEQVENGIPIRMALLYLITNREKIIEKF